MEWIGFVVERLEVAARGRAEHVVGHLDVGVAEIFGGLRPVADLRGVGADVARRKPGVELHGIAPRSFMRRSTLDYQPQLPRWRFPSPPPAGPDSFLPSSAFCFNSRWTRTTVDTPTPSVLATFSMPWPVPSLFRM